ncbi:hypothetical protein [Marinimicrobium alkaliphilum]|nr:hypothetical protein [Marinimicrobium alkaliphilum]
MLGQPFGCADTARCDELVAISDSGGMVNVTFEYQGNGEIALAAWE